MGNNNMSDKEKEVKREKEIHEKIDKILEELRKDDMKRIPTFEEFMAARNKKDFDSKILRRKDVVFTEAEHNLFEHIRTRIDELKINGIPEISKIYASMPDELREELLYQKIAYRNGRRIRFCGINQCVLKFFACEKEYPKEIHEEIFNCIHKRQNLIGMSNENRIIVVGVLEDLVNYDWNSSNIFNKSIKEIKKEMSQIVGQETVIEKMLKYYNILSHTRKPGPHILRIKAKDGMGLDTIVKAFGNSVGRYCEISCQNLGYDPEVTAGSSRVYCNATPGRLAEAIIRQGMQIIVLKNINDADSKTLAMLNSFFENTFVDNYYHIRVPNNVLIICTDGKTVKEELNYLFRDVYTIELEEYSKEECTRIMNNLICQYNDDFDLELTFEPDAANKVIESGKPKEIHKMVLNIFSEISFHNEFSDTEKVKKKLISLEDIE